MDVMVVLSTMFSFVRNTVISGIVIGIAKCGQNAVKLIYPSGSFLQ